jgi:hypothetical protein
MGSIAETQLPSVELHHVLACLNKEERYILLRLHFWRPLILSAFTTLSCRCLSLYCKRGGMHLTPCTTCELHIMILHYPPKNGEGGWEALFLMCITSFMITSCHGLDPQLQEPYIQLAFEQNLLEMELGWTRRNQRRTKKCKCGFVLRFYASCNNTWDEYQHLQDAHH